MLRATVPAPEWRRKAIHRPRTRTCLRTWPTELLMLLFWSFQDFGQFCDFDKMDEQNKDEPEVVELLSNDAGKCRPHLKISLYLWRLKTGFWSILIYDWLFMKQWPWSQAEASHWCRPSRGPCPQDSRTAPSSPSPSGLPSPSTVISLKATLPQVGSTKHTKRSCL